MSSDGAIYAAGVGTMLLCTFSNASGLALQRVAHRKLHEESETAAGGGPAAATNGGTPLKGGATAPHTGYGLHVDSSGGGEDGGGIPSSSGGTGSPTANGGNNNPTGKRSLTQRGWFCCSPWWIGGFTAQVIGGLCAVAGIALIGQARCAAFAGGWGGGARD